MTNSLRAILQSRMIAMVNPATSQPILEAEKGNVIDVTGSVFGTENNFSDEVSNLNIGCDSTEVAVIDDLSHDFYIFDGGFNEF